MSKKPHFGLTDLTFGGLGFVTMPSQHFKNNAQVLNVLIFGTRKIQEPTGHSQSLSHKAGHGSLCAEPSALLAIFPSAESTKMRRRAASAADSTAPAQIRCRCVSTR
jgi:hypothetical protein